MFFSKVHLYEFQTKVDTLRNKLSKTYCSQTLQQFKNDLGLAYFSKCSKLSQMHILLK